MMIVLKRISKVIKKKHVDIYRPTRFLGISSETETWMTWHGVWVNYNELTMSSLEIIVSKGNHPQMAARFRLVNYYNLPRMVWNIVHGTLSLHTRLFLLEWTTGDDLWILASMDRIRKNRVLVVTDLVTWLGRWFYSNVAERVSLLDARTSWNILPSGYLT